MPTPQLVTVLGDAGIGKTRLVATAVAHQDRPVLRGRCRAYDEGVPWWPLAEAFADAADIQVGVGRPGHRPPQAAAFPPSPPPDDLVASVATTVGLIDSDRRPRPLSRPCALPRRPRRQARASSSCSMTSTTPTTRCWTLLEALVTRVRELPLAVIAVARAALLERRSSWGSGVVNATTLLLDR
jgi:hypothetical protein